MNRRPLTSRDTFWAKRLASYLAKKQITPNQISCLSVVFSLLPFFCFNWLGPWYGRQHLFEVAAWQEALLFIGAAIGIQLRLLCNLIDGMVAVEGGKKSALGELFNEFPDRISDLLTIVPIGYMISEMEYMVELAWAAAAIAILTAYIRSIGAALTGQQFYVGPMAKPHRMALITVACLGSAVLVFFHPNYLYTFYAVLVLLNAGGLATCIHRFILIKRAVDAKHSS